jgi:long-subunit acyl-CoA synthetase (AMP-forming)
VAVKDERQDSSQNGRGLYLGHLLSNVKARLKSLVPDTPWKPGQPGILQVHSSANFIGYWRDAEATATTIGSDGYVDTGDIVTMAEGGHLWLVGRYKVSKGTLRTSSHR